ncbi:dihydrofolate reductase family protein [Actinacidiphila acididurans]|uniref:Dihydrofolate reductase family protein n=1 Tax=Actinacidiphila acididurans TaxID=2784346 RepID=A0ABS2TU20_9ACTN|nr:dihydrofolate reductase family protein [Actinacidiphila acididurans]MBM9505775.1 dihydrofolate reductase family protein [Actinacidiphila acididurans]
MAKTTYYTATSVDGFIADERNSLDWLFEVAGGAEGFGEFFAGVGAFAMGATTYTWVLEHEEVVARPEKWREWYGSTPSWVFSHRELPVVPGADIRFVRGDVRPVHAEMAAAAGDRTIWIVGGGELAGAFADHGLLDELVLGVAPVTLGAGAPLLPRRLTSARLALTDVTRSGQFAQLTYAVGRG